jgi:hypothetical protein
VHKPRASPFAISWLVGGIQPAFNLVDQTGIDSLMQNQLEAISRRLRHRGQTEIADVLETLASVAPRQSTRLSGLIEEVLWRGITTRSALVAGANGNPSARTADPRST